MEHKFGLGEGVQAKAALFKAKVVFFNDNRRRRMHIFWADLRTFRNFSGAGGTGQRGGQGLKTRRWGLAAGRHRRNFRPGAGRRRPEAGVIEVFHVR